MAIRNSAKAIIIRDGCLLVIEHKDESGPYFALPGGGQEPGETLADAVRRECREELGADIAVHHLAFVREGVNEMPHRVEFAFLCTLLSGPAEETASRPDDGQIGIAWLPLSRLERTRFFPIGLRALLSDNLKESGAVYLGHLP